jgi:hypothetical protein
MENCKVRESSLIRIDSSLNQFDGQILFPKKLEKANQILKKVGLPK